MNRRLWLLLPFIFGLLQSSVALAKTQAVIIGGPFTLVRADGTTVTDRDYRGKWLLVYFGYTFCPDTCPTALNEIGIAFRQLGTAAAALQALFITVDPDRDTPDTLSTYLQAFDPRIVGLTGTPQQIAAVARAYGAYYVRHKMGTDPQAYVLDHSTYIYLMDPNGNFVRAFGADTPGSRIADDIRQITLQSREQHVSTQER